MAVETLDIAGDKLKIEVYSWEGCLSSFPTEVSFEYTTQGCYDCSGSDVSISIDKEQAIKIVDLLKKHFQI